MLDPADFDVGNRHWNTTAVGDLPFHRVADCDREVDDEFCVVAVCIFACIEQRIFVRSSYYVVVFFFGFSLFGTHTNTPFL